MKTAMMKKIALTVLALLMAALCLTACGDSAANKLTIIDGNTKTEVEAKAGDKIADILKDAGITLGEKDTCEPAVDTELKEGVTEITIKRYTESTEPAPETAPASVIVEYVEAKETEKIPYSSEEAYSDSMEEGTSEVTQQGVDGEKEITYKVKVVNGQEVSREKISEKVIKEPVNEIVTYGTASYDDGGVYEVSRDDYPDCDGSGHGYYEIHYSDGSTEYVEY